MSGRSTSHGGFRRVAKGAAAAIVASSLVAAPGLPAAAKDIPKKSRDPAVISEWNFHAEKALAADTTTSVLQDFLYMGFVQAAVYNAVVGIEGRYAPYRFKKKAPRGASSQAATVAAAHKVLVTYLPAGQHAGLDAAYAESLAQIPDGKAETDGVAFGELAAGDLIRRRADDGRNDPSITYDRQPAPGVWRPTPPGMIPFLHPWMGFVDPLLVRSGAQFGEPGPPPALTSLRYAREFNEVKALGSLNSTARTPEQTATALFYSGNPFVQFNTALRDQVTVRKLDIVEAARMFAAVDMSLADAVISTWYSKHFYAFWRPITAIQLAETDGNPATTADPSWQPMLPTPPYPDYVGGYSAVIGAFAYALQGTFATQHLKLTFTSTAVPSETRFYDSARDVSKKVEDARVWLGFHFRSADTRGVEMGRNVANWALDHYFRPV